MENIWPSYWLRKGYEMGLNISYYVKRSVFGPKSNGATPSGQFRATLDCSGIHGSSFIILGDWGSHPYHTSHERRSRVRDDMVEWADRNHPDFVLSTGDNFYPTGITNVLDPKINRDWRKFYSVGWLENILWYISVGNHDHDGNVAAQVELSKREPRWILPNTWYEFDRVFDGDVNVHFVVLDTMLLVDDWHTYRRGSRDMSSNKQVIFMKESLRDSRGDWNIVVGHHPIYTGGLHGWSDKDNDVMQAVIDPILKQMGVNVYLCGHDHNLQYIIDHSTNLHYILSGSGSGENYCKYDRYENTLRQQGIEIVTFVDKPGFVTMNVTKTSLAFEFYVNGEIVYGNTINKYQPSLCEIKPIPELTEQTEDLSSQNHKAEMFLEYCENETNVILSPKNYLG